MKRVFKLIIDRDEFDVTLKKPAKGAWAETDVPARTITVSPKLRADAALDVLGHEIVHVWLINAGLDGFFDERQIESICDMFGRQLMLFIAENFPNDQTPWH